MASRKEHRHKPQPAPSAPAARPHSWKIFSLAFFLAVIIGCGIGTAIYFSTRKPIRVSVDLTPPKAVPTTLPDQATVYATYSGSDSCKECHAQAYDHWAKSHHGLAERAIDPAIDAKAFDPARSFKHGAQSTDVKSGDGKFIVTATGFDNKRTDFTVERVIGVEPLIQFLISHEKGRYQTLEASYDPKNNQWFNVNGDEDRQFGEWGHWTGRGMNWNAQCASCHNTRVRKNYDEAADSYRTAMVQPTVSCESCHGPMKDHVDWQKLYNLPAKKDSKPDPTIKRLSKDQTRNTCASCHARQSELTGDFHPRENLFDHYSLAIVDQTDTFYPDGQIREEAYEFNAFMGSKMHQAGVRCFDCHEPHSSKTILPGNTLCMRCHNGSFQGSPLIVPTEHSFHQPGSTGNECVNCHMPQTTYMQRHARHDHGFTVPDPLLTKQHGIPNACNRCHTDKDADWSLAAVEKWYSQKMDRPSRHRAAAIARAKAGDETALEPLLKLLAEEKNPYWQAVSTNMLSPWVGDQTVRAALLKSLSHDHPLVRENATRALEALAHSGDRPAIDAMRKLLNDPIRAVRVRAAWALRQTLALNTRAASDLLAQLDHTADQPTGAMRQGLWHVARGDLERGIEYMQKAHQWDRSAVPHYTIAGVYITQNRIKDAIDYLESACRLDPENAQYAFELALAYNEINRHDKALEWLGKTVAIDPNHARAWYNLGLAWQHTREPQKALEALTRAAALNPRDADIPYAAATVYASLNDRAKAIQFAQQALKINPNHREARALLFRTGQ